jgi:integrase
MPRKKKHVHGDGSVHQRKSDGRWQGQWTDEETKNRHTVYGRTEEECWQKLEEKKAEVARGSLVEASRLTVATWADEWMTSIKKVTDRPKTHSDRESIVRVWIIPALGPIGLQKLDPRKIQCLFIQPMIEEGLAASSIRQYYGVLHTLLSDAVIRRIIIKNPCEHIALPAKLSVERPVLSVEQVDLFLLRLSDHWLRDVVELAVYTAMREGELLALRWPDIDFDEMSLIVRGTVTQIAFRGPIIGPPKTKSSERRLALPLCAADLLRRVQAEQRFLKRANGPAWNPSGFVFPNQAGGLRHGSQCDYMIKKVACSLGLPENFTFHCFRHTAVATLIKEGVHPKAIQEICGHASIEMTMNLYGHLFEGMHREAMGKMDQAYRKARLRQNRA